MLFVFLFLCLLNFFFLRFFYLIQHFIGSLNGTHDINYHGEKILDRMKDGVNFSKQKSSDNNEFFPKVAEENVSLRKERDDAQKKV